MIIVVGQYPAQAMSMATVITLIITISTHNQIIQAVAVDIACVGD
jgi:hypothetical protein